MLGRYPDIFSTDITFMIFCLLCVPAHKVPSESITKTCLFKYNENFTTKNENVLIKKLCGAVQTSTHNLCFWAKIRKNNEYKNGVYMGQNYIEIISWRNLLSKELSFRVDPFSERMQSITKICLYNFDPLKPHFYIVKLGFTEVNIIV